MATMIPAGYMAKRVAKKPDRLRAPHVVDIYSVSSCISEDFADYVSSWKHNGYWLFDSPEVIRCVAREKSASLAGAWLFYYEVYESEFDGKGWQAWGPEPSFTTNVISPARKRLEGFDVVTFYAKTSPECSPLSCNLMAGELLANAHCLFDSLEEAKAALERGAFVECEPGPYRIFAVNSVDWP
jgi:hypothetical protein